MFKIEEKIKGSLGRAGVIQTAHGEIKTPAFVAVGTKATVKSLTPEQVKETGSQVVLANTYHLYLQPGEKIVKENGGLHKFMNWPGPIMTDSGGFQAFSLGIAYGEGIGKFISSEISSEEIMERLKEGKIQGLGKRKARVTEEGVEFYSVIDGSKHFLSPEKSIQIQQDLGADIVFALDEFTSPHAEHNEIRRTIERTERWAERCLKAAEHFPQKVLRSLGSSPVELFSKNVPQQALFGIVQGGRHEDLRKESAEKISGLGFEGFGIGGTFIKEDMATAVRWVNEILPEEKPRHLLGVGEPVDLILGVENGCDTFDCVTPTRHGRNGTLYTREGKISITNSKYKSAGWRTKLEENCHCYTCRNYTAAYLSHLFRAKEMLAATLATIHNLYFLNSLMAQMRQAVLDGKFFEFKERFLGRYKI